MYIIVHYAEDDGQGGIVFEELTCEKLKSVSFAPQTDLVGTSLPVNEFTVDVILDDPADSEHIDVGSAVELYDALDNLWASYLISYAEWVQAGVFRVVGRSRLNTLDGVKMPAVMYSGDSAADVIEACMGRYSGYVDIDSSFANATITGFCPEQTARERLTWVLFAINAYAKSFFSENIEILPIDNTETTIPVEKTFYKPTVNHLDYVTAVRAKTYSFTEGTPQTTDTYVTDDDGVTYIVTEGEASLSNPNVPYGVPDNTVEIEGVYLLNSSNVSAVLTNLSTRYFKRVEVEADVIDNAEYIPGDKVQLLTEPGKMHSGYIESADFSFGLQARAKLKLTACDNTPCAALTVLCKYNGIQIGEHTYYFPISYEYSVTMPFIDLTMNKHKYVFRPTTATVTGTMTSEGATVTVNYAVALDLYKNVLSIISVDGITTTTESGETVGVIS